LLNMITTMTTATATMTPPPMTMGFLSRVGR
jgi:hypothetical protein